MPRHSSSGHNVCPAAQKPEEEPLSWHTVPASGQGALYVSRGPECVAKRGLQSALGRVGQDPILLPLAATPSQTPHQLHHHQPLQQAPHALRTPRSPSSLAPCPGQEPAQVSLDRAINKIDHPPEPQLALAGPARSRRPASGTVSLIRERRTYFSSSHPGVCSYGQQMRGGGGGECQRNRGAWAG